MRINGIILKVTCLIFFLMYKYYGTSISYLYIFIIIAIIDYVVFKYKLKKHGHSNW